MTRYELLMTTKWNGSQCDIEFTTECRFYYYLLPLTKLHLAFATNVCWGQIIMNDEEIFGHFTMLICGYVEGMFLVEISGGLTTYSPLLKKKWSEMATNCNTHHFLFLFLMRGKSSVGLY